MNLEISWSGRAKEDYLNILEYIISEFGNASALKFDKHLEEVLKLIQHFPQLYSKI